MKTELTMDEFVRLLESIGMPPWATWIEAGQARQELPGATNGALLQRTWEIIQEKRAERSRL